MADTQEAIYERDNHKANFLWPHEDGSVEQAGYEFANARTEAYRRMMWKILMKRFNASKVKGKNKK